jgi:hypothetical protein
VHVFQRLVAPALRVPQETVEQRIEHRARDREAVHHRRQRAVGIDGMRAPGVDVVEPAMQAGHRTLRIVAEIDLVVGQAAEGVQRTGRGAHARRQQQRGGEEGLGAAAHQLAASALVVVRREVRGRDGFMGRQREMLFRQDC